MLAAKARYGLSITVPPASEPVSLAEAKTYLRVDIADDDALITSYITAARRLVELYTSTQLLQATYLWTLDGFFGYEMPGGQILLGDRPVPQQRGGGGIWPYASILRLPRHPLVSVSQILYADPGTGVLLTLDPSQYIVDTNSQPGRITPQYGTVWPVTREITNAVQITFVAGMSATAAGVPETFKTAIKMLLGPWYQRREELETAASARLPTQLQLLLGIEDAGYYP